MRVGIVTTTQFTLNALGSFVDVLRLASDEGDASRAIRCQWHVMSAGDRPLRASCGFDLIPNSGLVDPKKLDYLAVVGGLLYRGRQLDHATQSYLLDADKAGVDLIGICTGSFVLCRLGLMSGRKCCVSWFHYRDFIAEFDNLVPVADESYVVDGDRITSAGGVGSALAAAYLVDRHLDAESAHKALRIMQIDYTKSAAALQPAPPIAASCEDERVARATLMMERYISDPMSIDRLTSALRIPRRSLERLFAKHLRQSPLTAYRDLRLRRARWMLRRGAALKVAAAATGFANASVLARALQERDPGTSVLVAFESTLTDDAATRTPE